MTTYKKDGYTFIAPSRRKFKKYDVYKQGRFIASFGDTRYQQYTDKIGHYSNLNHYDKERKRLYYSRHGLNADTQTPKWFSHRYLW